MGGRKFAALEGVDIVLSVATPEGAFFVLVYLGGLELGCDVALTKTIL